MKAFTAREIMAQAEQANPGRRFAIADSRNAVGIWNPDAERFYTYAALGIDGRWYAHQGQEINANGAPVYTYAKAEQAMAQRAYAEEYYSDAEEIGDRGREDF